MFSLAPIEAAPCLPAGRRSRADSGSELPEQDKRCATKKKNRLN